jgi:hypothetical protein
MSTASYNRLQTFLIANEHNSLRSSRQSSVYREDRDGISFMESEGYEHQSGIHALPGVVSVWKLIEVHDSLLAADIVDWKIASPNSVAGPL